MFILVSHKIKNVLQQILGHDDPPTTLVYVEFDNVTVENEYRKYS